MKKENYTQQEQHLLLIHAAASILHGLNNGKPLSFDVKNFAEHLTQKRATFITLTINDQLRGCIGMLEAQRPLINDVAQNAFSAAFTDPRFEPLTPNEFSHLCLSISVLTPSEPITFHSEQDLLSQIRPYIDGLILQEGYHRGTFLPSVWETLSTPELFWQQLKLKASLPTSYWSDTLRVSRYETISFKTGVHKILDEARVCMEKNQH